MVPFDMVPVESIRRISSALLLSVATLLAAGCAPDSDGTEGDCSGFVKFDQSIYRLHGGTVAHVSEANRVGDGEWLGCDKQMIDTVDVYRIKRVDTRVAIAVRDSSVPKNYVVWVAEDSEPREWPDKIRRTS